MTEDEIFEQVRIGQMCIVVYQWGGDTESERGKFQGVQEKAIGTFFIQLSSRYRSWSIDTRKIEAIY